MLNPVSPPFLVFFSVSSSDLSPQVTLSSSVSSIRQCPDFSYAVVWGQRLRSLTRLRSLLGIPASVKPALLLTSAGRTCSTRFTRVLSHASEIRRGKTSARRKTSPSLRSGSVPAGRKPYSLRLSAKTA